MKLHSGFALTGLVFNLSRIKSLILIFRNFYDFHSAYWISAGCNPDLFLCFCNKVSSILITGRGWITGVAPIIFSLLCFLLRFYTGCPGSDFCFYIERGLLSLLSSKLPYLKSKEPFFLNSCRPYTSLIIWKNIDHCRSMAFWWIAQTVFLQNGAGCVHLHFAASIPEPLIFSDSISSERIFLHISSGIPSSVIAGFRSDSRFPPALRPDSDLSCFLVSFWCHDKWQFFHYRLQDSFLSSCTVPHQGSAGNFNM